MGRAPRRRPAVASATSPWSPWRLAGGRCLAALSLGCSPAGHDDPGTRHARVAARLLPTGAAPDLANAVAQALAHAGDEAAAPVMVTGDTAHQMQALTAVAARLGRLVCFSSEIRPVVAVGVQA